MSTFLSVLIKYPDIFKEKYLNCDLFLHIYFYLQTRSFGSGGGGIDSISVVPMADNLNHNSVKVFFEMMNISL